MQAGNPAQSGNKLAQAECVSLLHQEEPFGDYAVLLASRVPGILTNSLTLWHLPMCPKRDFGGLLLLNSGA